MYWKVLRKEQQRPVIKLYLKLQKPSSWVNDIAHLIWSQGYFDITLSQVIHWWDSLKPDERARFEKQEGIIERK